MIEKQYDERLSSYMDGELDHSAGFLDEITKCNDAKGCWQRFHIIRNVIRNDPPHFLNTDLSSRVMQALDDEPAIFSPKTFRTLSNRLLTNRFVRPVAGLAIAASVAALSIIGIQNYLQPFSGSELTLSAKDVSTSYPAPINHDFFPPQIQDSLSPEPLAKNVANDLDDLNAYMLEHMGHSPASSVQGMLPYVRVAGFDSDQ